MVNPTIKAITKIDIFCFPLIPIGDIGGRLVVAGVNAVGKFEGRCDDAVGDVKIVRR